MRQQGHPRVALDLRGLAGGLDIFRVAGGQRRDPAVESWLSEGPTALRTLARTWFEYMRECGADVRELMHDGCPVACVGDAPFGYVNAFKSHVNVGFFRGAGLMDPAGLLEGSGKRMRHVKLTPGVEPNNPALRKLIIAAYRDIRASLSIPHSSRSHPTVRS